MVVLGPLRRWKAIHMFASASQFQRGLGRRSRSGAITRIRTRTGTGTGRSFLERREGGHVGEAVQCRSLGLSLSCGRGHERSHTFDRSHRRTCRHQEYKRIVIIIMFFNFLCILGCCHLLYYTRSTSIDYGWNKRNRRTLSWREYTTYSAVPHVSSCHVLLHQTIAYASGRRSVATDEI